MEFWIKHIRKFILTFSLCLAAVIFFVVRAQSNYLRLEVVHLVEWYALLAAGFLYLTLLPGPLYNSFPNLSGRAVVNKARQSLGLSAFFFGALHAALAFFFLLDGFKGLSFLPSNYILAVILGASALLILTMMAVISPKVIFVALGKWWKRIQRLVYLAALAIIVHALMLGNHFLDLYSPIALTYTFAVFGLFVLEIYSTDKLMAQKHPSWPSYITAVILSLILLTVVYLFFTYGAKFGIHQH